MLLNPFNLFINYLITLFSIIILQIIIKAQNKMNLHVFAKSPLLFGLAKQSLRFRFGSGHDHEINYHEVVLRNEKSGYYLNPNEVARRIMRIISFHDNAKNVEKMTLSTQWWEIGLNEFDYVDVTVAVENDFNVEFPDDVAEKFKDINDMVEYIGRSYWAS